MGLFVRSATRAFPSVARRESNVKRLWRRISRYGHDRLTTPEERRPAGRASAALWLCGALTLTLTLPVPGTEIERPGLVAAIGVCGLAWGAVLMWLVPWERAPRGVFHLSTVLLMVAIAGLQPLTGAETSPAHEFLWLVIVYAAFFYPALPAVGYWIACSVAHAIPLLYAAGAVEGNLARELLVTIPASAIVAALVYAGREVLVGLSRQATVLEREQRRLAAEQASLRRVATAVAAGSPPQTIFTLVSAEAGRLLGADAATIGRYLNGRRIQMAGVWQGRTEPGEVIELAPEDEMARVWAERGPIRVDEYDEGDRSRVPRLGYRSFVGAPIHAGAGIWGAVGATARRPGAFGPDAEERLRDYADLIATAVVNAEDRAQLHAQAGIDPLTALPNHRAFRDRLEDEVSRARRHGRPLTAAVVDIDRYRALTEEIGPEAAEEALADIGRALRSVVRDEDVVARIGVDEFGIAFLESERATALRAAERARRLIATTPLPHSMTVTISVGLCDIEVASSADELMRRADAALFWSKEHGRDRCWVYDPAVVRDLEAYARRRELDREHGISGLRALARAIDAKDAATREHSERVAGLAARLAVERGWEDSSVERLREAGALHDVGKIGVPDAILLKPGRLDEAEMDLMRGHAALGARIVGDVLDETQARWIADHHERPDGRGYPSGLHAGDIPEGAALLALADAWDSMVCARAYSAPRPVDEALQEVRSLAGRQFAPEAVEALEALHERGALAMPAARMHQPTMAAAPA
jgi:diguanylate cyclase (GGDEF)-like protein